jgi:hypothetical protein
MPSLQKAFSHLVLAVFAAGALGCPCPAAAVTGHGPQADHEHHFEVHSGSAPAAEKDSYRQAQCQADCDQLVAESSGRHDLFPTAKPSLDPELKGPEPESIFSSGTTRSVTSIGPPAQSVRVAHETPVRRFDLLLD